MELCPVPGLFDYSQPEMMQKKDHSMYADFS